MNMETEQPKQVIEDVAFEGQNKPSFRLVWSVTDHVANLVAYKVMDVSEASGLLKFELEGSMRSQDWTVDHEKADAYLKGHVTWGACAQLDQGSPHWCGAKEFADHIQLLEHIYKRAFVLMDRDPLAEDRPWPLEIKRAPQNET